MPWLRHTASVVSETVLASHIFCEGVCLHPGPGHVGLHHVDHLQQCDCMQDIGGRVHGLAHSEGGHHDCDKLKKCLIFNRILNISM